MEACERKERACASSKDAGVGRQAKNHMVSSTDVLSQVETGDCKVKSACSTLAQVLISSNFSLEKTSSLKLKPSICVHSN